jgi:hypothetical protein
MTVPLKGYALPPEVMDRFASRAGLTDLDAIKEGKRRLAVSLDEEGLEILARSTASTTRDTVLEQLRAWTGGHPAGERPSTVDVPVLTLSTDDQFFSHDMLKQAAVRFRIASVERISGVGHWP